MFANHDYQRQMQHIYETIVICVSPFMWLIKIFLVWYFYTMGNFFLQNLNDRLKINKCNAKILFIVFGLLQVFSIVADDFITLFISGYIFEDIEFVVRNLPTIDFAMTTINEQVNPLNAIFILLVINYFAME